LSENLNQNQNVWSASSLHPRLFFLDARGVFPLALCLLHWSRATFALALLSVSILWVLERLGMPPNASLHYLRALLAGSLRPAGDVRTWRVRSRF
jgi:hypothetical protein